MPRRSVHLQRIAWAVLCLPFLASCGPSVEPEPLPPSAGKIKVTEVSLAHLPPGMPDEAVTLSDDHRIAAFAIKRGGTERVTMPGLEGPEFDSNACVEFLTDGPGPVFHGLRGGRHVVIANATVSRPYERADDFRAPAGSKRWAYIGRISTGREVAVVDGVEGKIYDWVSDLAFSPDGRHVVYAAQRDGQWRVILDNVEQPPYEFVDKLQFSPDSRRLTYVASRTGQHVAVVDGAEGPPFPLIDAPDGTTYGRNFFSPDSRHVAYIGRTTQDKGAAMVIDGHPGRQYDYVDAGPQLFHDKGVHWRYRGEIAGTVFDETDDRPPPRRRRPAPTQHLRLQHRRLRLQPRWHPLRLCRRRHRPRLRQ